MTPNAPAFPEPLPEEEPAADEGEAVETSLDAETVETSPAEATGVIETVDSVDGAEGDDGNTGEVELAPEETVPAETDGEE